MNKLSPAGFMKTLYISLMLLFAACSVPGPSPVSDQAQDELASTAVQLLVQTSVTAAAPKNKNPSPSHPSPTTTNSPTSLAANAITPSPAAAGEALDAAHCSKNGMNGPAVIIDPHPVMAFRQGPGCAYEALPPLDRLNPIVIYDLLGKNEDWWLVDLCNNEIGWIFSPSVALNNRMGDLDALPEVTAPPFTSNPSLQEPPTLDEASMVEAANTLVRLLDLLHYKQYEQAIEIFGGGYGIVINWNWDVDPSDLPTLLKRGCEWNGFECFWRVHRVIDVHQVSSMEFQVRVELQDGEGRIRSIYNKADPNKPFTQTLFTVVRDCQGFFWVIDWPPYEMYGG
jgi:hypothetical protein